MIEYEGSPPQVPSCRSPYEIQRETARYGLVHRLNVAVLLMRFC